MVLWLLPCFYIFLIFPYGLHAQSNAPDICTRSCSVNICDSNCILPNQPPNGKYVVLGAGQSTTPTPGTAVGNSTVLYYTCKAGYKPVHSNTAICLQNEWVTDFQECEKITECTLPENPKDGGYNIIGSPNLPNPGEQVKEWTALTYYCDTSFVLIGQNTAVCRNGQWSSNPPVCRKTDKCVLPQPPSNGQYVIIGSTISPVPGQTAADLTALSFSCADDYTLYGDSIVICSGGVWLGKFPTCKKGNQQCTLPNFPQNGDYTLLGSASTPVPGTSVNEKETLQYVCKPGYILVGKDVSTCIGGKWTSDAPSCLKPDTENCVVPNPPKDGYYSIIGSSSPPIAGSIVGEGTTLQYKCKDGFKLVGTSTITCTGGKWTPEVPRCAEITKFCSLPQHPKNGFYSIAGQSEVNPIPGTMVPDLTVLTFFCNKNCELIGGGVSVCVEGQWLGEVPICLELKPCTLPPYPEHGSYLLAGSGAAVVPGGTVKEKETITYTCLPNFQLVGSQCSTCKDGSWSIVPPKCIEQKGCVVPYAPDKGSMSLVGSGNPPVTGTTIAEKETLQFTCKPGYQLVGKETSTCSGGQWTSKVPKCEEIIGCTIPYPPDNGDYTIIGSLNRPTPGGVLNEKESLQYSCKPGYQLVGQECSVCLAGKWSSEPPTCKEIKYCRLPKPPANGKYVVIGSTEFPTPGDLVPDMTVIYFACNGELTLVGGSLALCTNGMWLGEQPTCKEIKYCTLPEFQQNGKYDIIGSTDPAEPGFQVEDKETIQFVCYPGFQIVGNVTSTCFNGKWTTEVPKCEGAKTCIIPNPPDKGCYTIAGTATPPIAGSSVDEATTLEYTCKYGLELIGSDKSTCLGGKWTTEVPRCVEKTGCIVPKPPAKGTITLIGSSTPPTPGSTVAEYSQLQFTCYDGLVLVGEAQSKCIHGNWSSEVPLCLDKGSCVVPKPPQEGSYVLIGSATVPQPGDVVEEWSTLKFVCKDGWELVGKLTSTCASGKWSSAVPVCNGNKVCVLPAFQTNGRYRIQGSDVPPTPGQTVKDLSVIQFSCDPKYTLVGMVSSTCIDEKWSNQLPQCIPQQSVEDCSGVEGSKSGVYKIQPPGCAPFEAYCDMDLLGGKWTVILSRFDGSVNFEKNYQEYTDGFGSASAEYWLGLEKIHHITNRGAYELYVDLNAYNGEKKFARYSKFFVSDAMKGYTLSGGGFAGTAGDSLEHHYEMMFSTYDKDQDGSTENCAEKWKGGWWYNNCHFSHPTGIYYTSAVLDSNAMYWYHMFNNTASLKSARMLIRKSS